MELKYPLARLSVFYQLNGRKISCSDALVNAAYETGLIPNGSLDSWLKQNTHSTGSCSAIFAARRIVETKLEELHEDDNDLRDQLTDEIMVNINSGLESYSKERIEKAKDQCSSDPNNINCGKLAPVILDFLIQQLRQH